MELLTQFPASNGEKYLYLRGIHTFCNLIDYTEHLSMRFIIFSDILFGLNQLETVSR